MKTRTSIRVVGLSVSLLFIHSSLISVSSGKTHHPSHFPDGKYATLTLDSLDGLNIHAVHENGLDPVKVSYNVATYRGRRALHLLNDDSVITKSNPSGGQSLAIVNASDLKEGSIEADLVGLPRKGSSPDTRGFVGLAFHVQDNGARFEAFYLRFTNGRADDQLHRNHTTQYVSEPDFPWFRLRKENPGVYESYVDIEQEAWTNLRVEITGTKARLYVNHAVQPCLIVNDLKLGEVRGQVALWDGSDTEAYFSDLRIDQR